MNARQIIPLLPAILLAGCVGSTKPDEGAAPAPVEDRSISAKRPQAHIVNKPSEVLPMQQARAEPSKPRPEPVVVAEPAKPQPAPAIADVALLETTKGVEPLQDAPQASTSSDSPAVDGLLADANRQLKLGNHDGAAASLERALRVEPRDAYLWHRLAYVRLKQARGSQAEAMALKSISLSGDKAELINSNWRLIARARKMLNDEAGAREASAKIQ